MTDTLWRKVIDSTETYVEKLGVPELAIIRPANVEDFLPPDPSNTSGKELSDKLFEYSSYVSYLDAELGRIDSQRSVIQAEFSSRIEEHSLVAKTSKPKARASIILSDDVFRKAEKRLVELDALYKRIAGLREGYYVRMNAISREISRRATER